MTDEKTPAQARTPVAPPEDLFDLLGEDGEQFKKPAKPEKTEKTDDDPPAALPDATDGAIKKAAELKVDLAEVKGSGKDGRIVAGDVQKVATERMREKSQKSTEAKKKEPEVYDKDRIVHYAGHRIEVPTREMQLEGVRAMLEEQFPELSKERTEMLYDEEKGLVIPVLKGHRKGGAPPTEQPLAVHLTVPEDYRERPVFHLLGDDGVYEVRSTQTGTFVARLDPDRPTVEGVSLKVPKIPSSILSDAVIYLTSDPETERLVNIVYSYQHAAYGLHSPKQNGSASHVESDGLAETDETFIVLQIHSHGVLPAFFSATDDADEVRTGLYGVLGRCHRRIPHLKLRYSCGGKYRPVDAGSLFNGSLTFVSILDLSEPEEAANYA